MKNILRLEELAMASLVIYLMASFHADWWWYLLFAVGPDISMIGYVAGNRVGAVAYNLFHHKAVAISVFIIGIILLNTEVEMVGLVLFGHSSLDRIFGYGLKTTQGFQYTHLGMIGKKKA